MSGSGPTVFGVFGRRSDAAAAAHALRRDGLRAVVTRTLGRKAVGRLRVVGPKALQQGEQR
jgi:4-diphosphocytidyl-2C-methyl-D-erythritol kinase